MDYTNDPLWTAAVAATDPHEKLYLLGELGSDLSAQQYDAMLLSLEPDPNLVQDVDDYVQWTIADHAFARDVREQLRCVKHYLDMFCGFLNTHMIYKGLHVAYEWAAFIGRAAVVLSGEQAPSPKWAEAFRQIKSKMK